MKFGPFLAVLVALFCVATNTAGEPLKESDVDLVPAATRINPRFYVKVDDQRSIAASGAEEDDLTAEEEAELAEDEEDGNDVESDEAVETYYPVSDDSGQTYLIPESVLELMAEKQEDNDDSDTYLVPNGSVNLDDEEAEEGESNSAIILSEGSEEDSNALIDGNQYIAVVQEPEDYGKSRRIQVRRGGGLRRRRGGGRRRRRRRGGSRQGLKRRRTRRKIRRGGGARGGRRRNRRGGGGGGGRIRLGRVRLRPRRGFGFRF